MTAYDLAELLNGVGVGALTEELKAQVDELVKKDDRYKPAYINITAPHALYMEFGTNPCHAQGGSQNTSSRGEGENESGIANRIYIWAKTIGIIPNNRPKNKSSEPVSDDEYRRLAFVISRKIMQFGLAPKPFIRPVLYDEKLLENAREIIANGGSVEDVANLYADRMIGLSKFKYSASGFKKPYDDELHIYESISVSDSPLNNAKTNYDFSYENFMPQIGVKKYD